MKKIIKYIKRWWAVKKAAKKLWNIVEIEKQKDSERRDYIKSHAKELADKWVEKNEFGFTLKDLQGHCITTVVKNNAKNVIKDI